MKWTECSYAVTGRESDADGSAGDAADCFSPQDDDFRKMGEFPFQAAARFCTCGGMHIAATIITHDIAAST